MLKIIVRLNELHSPSAMSIASHPEAPREPHFCSDAEPETWH
jgi:hypothetical protein